ncbi:MAG: hypothetical protein FJY85_21805, partial [Deltaproteobacteria bacterium]|nr:hypothetical protein [Deltaproteobacteria bacterium]
AQMFGEPADEMRIQMRTLFAQEHAGLADEIRKGCRRTACLALGVIGSPYADSAKHMLEAIAADEDEAPEVRNQVVFNAVLTLTARSKDKDSASSVRESLVQLARDKTRKRKEEEREKREEAERSEREYRIQSDRRARGQCIMCGKRLGFVLRAFRRTTHAHCTSFSEGAKPKTVAEPTQAKPTPAASPIPSGQPPPAKTVTCPACGHVQRKGDWEREMDKRAKAQGMKGFVNLSAPPQCLKCEAALDGSDTKKQEVSGVCDICNRATSTGSGGKVFKNKEMKRATERGFNGMAIGPNARMLAVVGISKNETYGQWKQKVTLDTTDWLLCPECQKEIRNYM